jgi:hypothetical protein
MMTIRPYGLLRLLTEKSAREINKKMFLESSARQMREADILTATCEPIV